MRFTLEKNKMGSNKLKYLNNSMQEMQVEIITSHVLFKKKMTKIFKESITSIVNDGRVKLVFLYQLQECKLGTTRKNLSIWIKNLKNVIFFDQ